MDTEGSQASLPEQEQQQQPDDSLNITFDLESTLRDIYSNGFAAPLDSSEAASSTVPPDPESQLEREASLLMFYLDHVFHLQFPFLLPPACSGGRYWLLSLLTSTKPVYYATLSLAAMHFSPLVPAGESEEGRAILKTDQRRFYVMALQELQVSMDDWNSNVSKKDQRACIGALACILQLICVESTISRIGTWSAHLDAASTLIPALMRYSQEDPHNPTSPSPPPTSPPRPMERSPGPEVYEARKFLLGAFLWLDTLSGVARGSQSLFYGYQYVFELDNNCIVQEQISGCDKWVVALLMETIELGKWKRTLRVRDLARRAVAIEHQLEQRISDMLHPTGLFADQMRLLVHDKGFSSASSSNTTNQHDQDLHLTVIRRQSWVSSLARWRRAGAFCITYLHALASLTYLHVVVDGFKPELPEIRSSVTRAIEAFRNLPDVGLLRHLLLPMCVIGSLAHDPEHRGALRDVLTAAIDSRPDDSDTAEESGIETRMLVDDSKTALQTLEVVWLMQDHCIERGEELEFGFAMHLLGGPICFL